MSIYFLSPDIDIESSAPLEKILRKAIPSLIKIRNIEEIVQESSSASQDYVLLVGSPQHTDFFDRLIEVRFYFGIEGFVFCTKAMIAQP